METNKIYLGDAYKLIKEIPDGSIDLIVTDPPYQIDSLQGGGMLKEKRIQNLMQDLGENNLDVGIDKSILDEFMRVMKKPNIYIWMNLKQLYPYLEYFVGKHHCNWNLIVWQKSNAMPLCGSKYLNDCEYCAYFFKGVKLNTKYESAKTVYVKPINIEDKNNFGHPTIKPIDIIENFIKNSSNENDIILDPFLGSGTTALAAKHLKRNYIGFEINENYFKISKERLDGINQKGEMNLFDI
jgi:DNA modification methylase